MESNTTSAPTTVRIIEGQSDGPFAVALECNGLQLTRRGGIPDRFQALVEQERMAQGFYGYGVAA